MEKTASSILEKLRLVMKGWGLILILSLGVVIAFASVARDTGASGLAQSAAPTVDPMAGHNMSTPTPQFVAPAAAPATTNQSVTGTDLDALAAQMQTMMNSLNGMMLQLDQKGANLTPPTATPVVTTVDLQPLMAELQAINQNMGPLMVRIQADLQGNPTAEELASVRLQLQQIQTLMVNLMTKLQAARNGVSPVAAVPTQDAMAGMNPQQPAMSGDAAQSQAMIDKLNELQQRMQGMLQTMQQNQQTQPGTMPGMPGISNTSPQVQATPMPGMTTTDPSMSSPMMDEMMMMMDNMMMMMDNMMGGMGSGGAMPTPDPGMSMPDM